MSDLIEGQAPSERVPSWALLALGVVLTLLTGARWNIALLAWVSAVPFLLYARRIGTWRGWLVLLGVTSLATTLQVLKIITAPVSPVLAPCLRCRRRSV